MLRPFQHRCSAKPKLGRGILPFGAAGFALYCFQRGTLHAHSMVAAQGGDLHSMVATKAGTYTLVSGRQGVRSGAYEFDLASRRLIDSRDGFVGTFSAEPILKTRSNFLTSGNKSIPVMTVCNSEIMTEIQKPANDGAYFVLPSQLNGAEYTANDRIVWSIDDYRFDRTGGPRGQLAVHPAVGQFILDNAANDQQPGGINAVREIVRQLQAKGFEFHLENGYLRLPRIAAEQHESCVGVVQENLHTLRILRMDDVPAQGLTPDHKSWSEASHKVNLIYASAVPVQAYVNQGDEHDERLQTSVGSLVILAQYLGALKAAAERATGAQPTKVFLMLLGGGAFNNPLAAVFGGMSKAVELLSDEELRRLDIHVLTWKGNPNEEAEAIHYLTTFQKFRHPTSKL